MRGPEAATALVAEWLTPTIPTNLARYRTASGITARDLPDPQVVIGHDENAFGIENWPVITCVPARMLRLGPAELGDGGQETYTVTYEVNVLSWVRHEHYPKTARLRDRYALAVREALLHRRQLTKPGADVEGAWVVPDTIREDYMPVTLDPSNRTIACVETTFELVLVETLDAPDALGRVEKATVTTVPMQPPAPAGDTPGLPPHPAYD